MPKMADIKKKVESFQLKVTRPIEANKGSATFKQVQQVAQAIPAALKSPLEYLEEMGRSGWSGDKAKIPVYFKMLKSQWAAIKLAPVQKYIADHQPGGAKNRQAGIRGVFSTKSAVNAETTRVGLCTLLLQKHADLNKLIVAVRSPKDFTDLNFT